MLDSIRNSYDTQYSRPAGLQTSHMEETAYFGGCFLQLFNYFTLMYTFHGSKDEDLA